MAHPSRPGTTFRLLAFLAGIFLFPPPAVSSASPPETMTLSQAVETALSADLSLKSAREGVQAAAELKQVQKTRFFPSWGMSYEYRYNDSEQTISPQFSTSRTEVTLATSLTQPVFTGFALTSSYALTDLSLRLSETRTGLLRQDLVLGVKQAYFNFLKFQKLLQVAEQRVAQIKVQKNVADNFYQVGMTPLNDLLQAQVELANADQALTVAVNNLRIAGYNFNTILRRPIDAPVALEEITDTAPFVYDLAYCQEEARNRRLEMSIADIGIEMAAKEIDLAKSDYYPTVNVSGTYFRQGDSWEVDGGDAILDPDGWYVSATASWRIWEWGKTRHAVNEKRRRLEQARYERESLLDRIRLEVRQAFLRTREAEENIQTAKTAIEQARENYRINQERYKEQVATNTDVLIAQTLLTQTMTNYYNAVYDYQLSKASLFRAMGREDTE